MKYISALEFSWEKSKNKLFTITNGDIPDTFASVDNLKLDFDYKPSISVTKALLIL